MRARRDTHNPGRAHCRFRTAGSVHGHIGRVPAWDDMRRSRSALRSCSDPARTRCPRSRASGLESTAWRLTCGPPPSAGTFPRETDVQAHLGPALLPLVELAAGGERVAVLAGAAARGDRQRVDLDVEVAPLAQQVHLAVGHPAEVPARPPARREVLDPLATDAPLARHRSAWPRSACDAGLVNRRA